MTLDNNLHNELMTTQKVSPAALYNKTRFGPNRPAADMEGNGEFDFWIIFGEFLNIFGEIGSLLEED